MSVGTVQQEKITDASRMVEFYGFWLWNYMTAENDTCFDPRLIFDDYLQKLETRCQECDKGICSCPACEIFTQKQKHSAHKIVFKPSIWLLIGDESMDFALREGKIFKSSSQEILLEAYGINLCRDRALSSRRKYAFCPELPVHLIGEPLSHVSFDNYELNVKAYISTIQNTAVKTNTNKSRALGFWLWDTVTHTREHPSVEKAIEHLLLSNEYPKDFFKKTLFDADLDEADVKRKARRLHQRTVECITQREVLSIR